MGLKRTGGLLFGLGLLFAPLAAALSPAACTEVACPGAPFSMGFAGVDAGAIAIAVRCNTCYVTWPVILGVLLLQVGAVLAVVGAGYDLLEEW